MYTHIVIALLIASVSAQIPVCPGGTTGNWTDDCTLLATASVDCNYHYEFKPDTRTAYGPPPLICQYPPSSAPDQTHCYPSSTYCITFCGFGGIKTTYYSGSCGDINDVTECAETYTEGIGGGVYNYCEWYEDLESCVAAYFCYN